MNISRVLNGLFVVLIVLSSNISAKTSSKNVDNPEIGVVGDFVIDLHNADDNYKTNGLTIRAIELAFGSNIDPFARLEANILVNANGVELHEAYALFHSLPFSLQAKVGRQLINFGHLASFHTHALPTVTQPKIYNDYAGGFFALDGIEFSWLMPFSHYVEFYAGVFNNMNGHTHDSDPIGKNVIGKYSCPSNPPPGTHCHGSFIHGEYDPTMVETDKPVTIDGYNIGFKELAYFGKLKTTFELGDNFSIDLGASAIYSQHQKVSTIDEKLKYSSLVQANDLTLFWHPLTSNLYRSFQLGFENVNTIFEDEQQVRISEDEITLYKVDKTRSGLYSYFEFRQNNFLRYGVFGEFFENLDDKSHLDNRYGAFVTINPSHFQYFRLEFNRYDKKNYKEPINSFILQYDVVIGYHTHGDKR